ncbi:MAG: phosphoribosylanthranilate isomerase [Clostridiaceae bacterium]|mgnify:CR=1 FL=1|nr:phosphoribosylanthranilate isomerase [Clostridiaceae bacterium]
MTLVKVCGLRREEDANIVNACLPDYIGFVFAPSKRRVSAQEARRIRDRLDSGISCVGVFTHTPVEEIVSTAKTVGLDVIQLHWDTTEVYLDELIAAFNRNSLTGIKIWQRIPIPDEESKTDEFWLRIHRMPNLSRFDALLFDICVDQSDGGSGVAFPWEIGKRFYERIKIDNNLIFVAGGLDPMNVEETVRFFSPFGVDASSLLETDGFKDNNKVCDFVIAARKVGSHS